ncbi:MAG: hypothetical protein ACKO2K_06525, partial [Alphaproteobacteria bacterium]
MRTEPTTFGIARAALAMLLVACGYLAWAGWNEPRWSTPEPTGHHLPLYGRSLLEGHAWVRPAPPEMSRLPDPWDPEQYRGLEYFDLSYWNGRLYSYFGVVPALTLFAPWTALSGAYLTEAFAAALYASAGFAVAFGLLLAIRRRLLPAAPGWSVALAGAVLAGGNLVLLLLLPLFYGQVVQASAWFWLAVALAAGFASTGPGARARAWLAVSSLACGLMVGSRPSHAGATLLLLPFLAAALADRRGAAGRRSRGSDSPWRLAACAALPLAIVIAGLLAFNQARFGSPFEFGLRFQQFGQDRRRLAFFSLDWAGEHLASHLFNRPPMDASFPFFANEPTTLGALVFLPFDWLVLLVPAGLAIRDAALRRRFVAVASAAALATVAILLVTSSFYLAIARHAVDFLLPASWLAGLGLVAAAHGLRTRPWPRRTLALVAGLLAAVSIASTLCASMADWNHPELPWFERAMNALAGLVRG